MILIYLTLILTTRFNINFIWKSLSITLKGVPVPAAPDVNAGFVLKEATETYIGGKLLRSLLPSSLETILIKTLPRFLLKTLLIQTLNQLL